MLGTVVEELNRPAAAATLLRSRALCCCCCCLGDAEAADEACRCGCCCVCEGLDGWRSSACEWAKKQTVRLQEEPEVHIWVRYLRVGRKIKGKGQTQQGQGKKACMMMMRCYVLMEMEIHAAA
jgi:hypothetical protein